MADYFPGRVLGIETSCDETSAAVLEGSRVLSNVVSSQAELHRKWGGIVPEAAARAHVESILPVIEEALRVSGTERPSAIAVTNRPGLVGALSVGLTAGKSLARSWSLPFAGVHHLEGHVLSTLLDGGSPSFPQLCLIVSGGHTETVRVAAPGDYELLGQTIDDAAGEAFDKGARLLGLGYPGGQAVEKRAEGGDPKRYSLPRSLRSDPFNFSFSGLKTAVLRLTEKEGDGIDVADAAASLQAAIVDVLSSKALHAAEHMDASALTVVGGVAANRSLRARLAEECDKAGIGFFAPEVQYCTDNAAMIALAGSVRLASGERSDFWLDAQPNAPLPGTA
ncbi:MAG: tRNA (adenosine(37)-N6)-threonylcarbamoyltransferase complex transferase subunit TsaD [Armatimonadetes bacterium]|nr:tRNA (adenosine(37)-N6)-threonylcarbamoyltransferase complex transferase subunit TsaD [Armatimonadota bacterium]